VSYRVLSYGLSQQMKACVYNLFFALIRTLDPQFFLSISKLRIRIGKYVSVFYIMVSINGMALMGTFKLLSKWVEKWIM
jgi:hypothetical protein